MYLDRLIGFIYFFEFFMILKKRSCKVIFLLDFGCKKKEEILKILNKDNKM